jgi:predicted phage terminase large subunit-like protein
MTIVLDLTAVAAGYSEPSARELLSRMPVEAKERLVNDARAKLRLQAEESLYAFFRQAWPHIWPNIPFRNAWYYRELAGELQRLAEGVFTNNKRPYHLNVNILPGSGKTSLISIAFPAWAWLRDPTRRFITTSYSPKLAEENNNKSTQLIRSRWFQENWSSRFSLVKELDTETRTSASGYRITTSPGSKIGTGFHCDFHIGDDIQNAEEVYSKVYRLKVQRWLSETISSRLVDKVVSVMVNIQQRLHGDDVTAYLRKNEASLYKFIVLPGELSEKVEPKELAGNYVDGLLDQVRFPREVLDVMRVQLRNAASGQIRQDPIAEGGNMFKDEYPRFFTREQLPPFSRIIVSADTAQTDNKDSCPASIQVWGEARPNFYLLYDETRLMSPGMTAARIGAIAKMYPGSQILIENAASGFGIIEELKKTFFGVFPFPPQQYGGKEKRAESILYLWESGNVFLPESQHIRTVYLPEIVSFPLGEYKDRVDAMSQALIWLTRGSHKGAAPLPSGIPIY